MSYSIPFIQKKKNKKLFGQAKLLLLSEEKHNYNSSVQIFHSVLLMMILNFCFIFFFQTVSHNIDRLLGPTPQRSAGIKG